jgi:hypothetical protein
MAHKVSRDENLIPILREHVKKFPPDPKLVAAIEQYRKATKVKLQPALRMILHVLEGKS